MAPTPPHHLDAARALLDELMPALAAGRRHDVDRIIARLLASRAPIGRQWRSMAHVSRQNGALGHVRAAMDAYLAADNGSDVARFERAAMLAEIGDLTRAEDALNALPPGFPDPATRAHFLGTLSLGRGDLARARALFEVAIAARPESGPSWLALTDAQRSLPAQDWAPAVFAASSRFAGVAGTERASYLYALGAAHDAVGDHDAAFAAFAEGAAIIRPLRPYDARADRLAADQARLFRLDAGRPDLPTDRTIFVFGPPRSGTTLVEQILASHSAVAGGGEVGLFDLVASRVGGLTRAHLDTAFAEFGRDTFAADYLALATERFGTKGRIIDKTLSSTRLAGLIASILPEAPLVWVTRNPLDTAWSCFRTLFTQGVTWSWDQRDLAAHLRLEDAMLDFWRGTLGDRLLVLDYAALVSDPRAQIERLLTHCGLPVQPAVFEPHKTRRAVTTASVTQVRSPITTRAVGAATPYRRHLQPFIDAYTAAGGTID